MFLLRAEAENIISVLEDHMLESISSTLWKPGEEEADFSFVTEKYNHFLKNFREEDIRWVHVLFAVIFDHHLIVSSIGKMCAILRESNESLSIIHEASVKYVHFESFSSGEIPDHSTLFLSSEHVEDTFGEEFYDDAARVSVDQFETTLKSTLSREGYDSVHMARIISENEAKPKGTNKLWRKRSQSDVIRNTMTDIIEKIHVPGISKDISRNIQELIRKNHTFFLVGFLWIGILLFFGLISVLISTLFQVSNNGNNDSRNQLIQAKTLIEQSQELTSNPAAFAASIEKAQAILNTLKKENIHIKDTQELSGRIEAMKKEMYDIQTIDLTKKKSIAAFNPNDLSPLGVFESQKKLNIIGKNGMILGYALGNSLPKVIPYPSSEEVTNFVHTESDNFYLLTKNNRILGSRKQNEIDYVNVMGQDGWEKANKINTFNDYLYLIDTAKGEIYRHKPWVNGFSQKTEVGDTAFSGVIDVWVDGAFYILQSEWILRILGGKSYTTSKITLNGIPGTYEIKNPSTASLFLNKNIKYRYILDGNNIWIFEPDSKNFQDVKAWNYIAQLNISTLEEIRSIDVPRDGLIYVTTNMGIYDIPFEISNKNLIIR